MIENGNQAADDSLEASVPYRAPTLDFLSPPNSGPGELSATGEANPLPPQRESEEEVSTAWSSDRPSRPDFALADWPRESDGDENVASVLFQAHKQRRQESDEESLADGKPRLGGSTDSLASLLRGNVLRSGTGSAKSTPRLALPSVGDELFGFRMRDELGRGAFACVFLAEQAHLASRPVVLKISALEGNEPQTLAQLQHTNIVPIYSVHEDAPARLRAVCMPYFGGASLSAVLRAVWDESPQPTRGAALAAALEVVQSPKWEPKGNSGTAPAQAEPNPLAWLRSTDYYRAAAQIVAQLADGLNHAHERGIYHRDIKPSNILLAADGTPMLLDFNLAEDLNSPQARASATLGGTVSYMSPEHLRALAARDAVLARQVDHRSDIYALGMVLHEMLIGQSPFKQSASYAPVPTLIEAMAAERSTGAPSLRQRRSQAPWDLESILRKCLAPAPEHRYQSAAALAEDLRAFLENEPLRHAPQLSRVERFRKWMRRHPRIASSSSVAGVAAALLITAMTALFSVRTHLESAEVQVQANTVRDKLRRHDAGTVRALCLINTVAEQDSHIRQGIEVCEKTLALFGSADRGNGEEDAGWQYLEPEERERLAQNTRELLLLLAWARVRNAPGNEAVLRDALDLVDRAETIAGLQPTPAIWYDRAHYLAKLGDRAGADAARARAREIKPTSARDYYLLATAHVRDGGREGYAKAEAALTEALRLNPHYYWASAQRGLVHFEQGDYVMAARDFGDCAGLDPDSPWGYFNCGVVLDRAGNKKAAIAEYAAALKRDPEWAIAYQNRGLAELELGLHEKALADFDAAIARGRSYPAVLVGRAMALEGLKRPQEADAAFDQALAKADADNDDPSKDEPASLRLRIAFAFRIAGRDPARARHLFEDVLARNPRDSQALYGLGMLAAADDRPDKAISYFTRALDIDPAFAHCRRFRAVIEARLGQVETALNDINWCLERDPNSGATLYAAACVAARLAERTNPAAAETLFNKALDYLDSAFKKGYGRDRAENDPDLASLRTKPGYQKLLAK